MAKDLNKSLIQAMESKYSKNLEKDMENILSKLRDADFNFDFDLDCAKVKIEKKMFENTSVVYMEGLLHKKLCDAAEGGVTIRERNDSTFEVLFRNYSLGRESLESQKSRILDKISEILECKAFNAAGDAIKIAIPKQEVAGLGYLAAFRMAAKEFSRESDASPTMDGGIMLYLRPKFWIEDDAE